ncbi:MAG: hypothetical protein LBD21_10885 [Tannerellaceae bacterium]|jgi:hypothetical protein|nr:hypothetical protein [Tannerellaceae bacterium]
MKLSATVLLLAAIACLTGCSKPAAVRQSDLLPDIYPDYADVTIPYNIAPLHFLVRNNPSATEILLRDGDKSIRIKGRDRFRISIKRWRRLLSEAKGRSISVEVKARFGGEWVSYKPFRWHISEQAADPFITYRLIEPGYEVWNHISLCRRNITNFGERTFADNNLTDRACINCHIPANQDPRLSFFHIRGKNGGTLLNRDGRLSRFELRMPQSDLSPTYGALHPGGRYAVFSANRVVPAFHTTAQTMLEVYDQQSELAIVDFDEASISPLPLDSSASGAAVLPTFPTFSPDGSRIYFCAAEAMPLPDSIRSMRYILCSTGFDAASGTADGRIDTLLDLRPEGLSISFPRISPDGRFLLYCTSAYGTFPIWHRETDLRMLNLQSGEAPDISAANSPYSDTWHSWSSEGRWIAFASKRDDGLYGKVYLCHIDPEGNASKAFVLPQRNPGFYDNTLKSFNLPEFIRAPLPFSAADVERALR